VRKFRYTAVVPIDRTTIAQIAAQAETSVSTVSKVLNGRPGVSDAKRDEVLALLREAEYRRRGEGRRSPSRLIDLVLPDIASLWSGRLLSGAENEAERAGVSLVVSVMRGRALGNQVWLKRFQQRHSDGLLIVAARIRPELREQLSRLRTPSVMLDAMGTAPPDVPVVGATNYAGGRDATAHLMSLGHRRIGIISGPPDLYYSQQRLGGYRAALAEGGIQADPVLEHYGEFDQESGYQSTRELLSLPQPPTAIFAGNDLQAHGVYQAASELGVSIPGGLSVVGFDNLPSCEWAMPRLTSVNQPLEEMATHALRILVNIAHHNLAPAASRIELATNLVIRESTAPCPER
jgi:DNA-binding LacI/PurR family transcriptional regulator